MPTLFLRVKKFIDKSFNFTNTKHFERTVFWVQKLKPNASEALIIAAYSHDIERAFRKKNIKTRKFVAGKELKYHQKEGARIIYEFLTKNNADEKLAKKVQKLISKHEVGGSKDQNLLKDADSISYFETNAMRHTTWVKEKGFSKKEIERKFNWMYERITSKEAKRLAFPHYQKALKSL